MPTTIAAAELFGKPCVREINVEDGCCVQVRYRKRRADDEVVEPVAGDDG